jgi:hypothetical protein
VRNRRSGQGGKPAPGPSWPHRRPRKVGRLGPRWTSAGKNQPLPTNQTTDQTDQTDTGEK